MSGDARDFNNIEMRAVIKLLFFLQGKAPKEIHAIEIDIRETCTIVRHFVSTSLVLTEISFGVTLGTCIAWFATLYL
jgi:hypothetical protein